MGFVQRQIMRMNLYNLLKTFLVDNASCQVLFRCKFNFRHFKLSNYSSYLCVSCNVAIGFSQNTLVSIVSVHIMQFQTQNMGLLQATASQLCIIALLVMQTAVNKRNILRQNSPHHQSAIPPDKPIFKISETCSANHIYVWL